MDIAFSVNSETGWRALFVYGTVFSFQHIFAWGVILDNKKPGIFKEFNGKYVPLSASGEVLSNRQGFIGIVDPSTSDDEAVTKWIPIG